MGAGFVIGLLFPMVFVLRRRRWSPLFGVVLLLALPGLVQAGEATVVLVRGGDQGTERRVVRELLHREVPQELFRVVELGAFIAQVTPEIVVRGATEVRRCDDQSAIDPALALEEAARFLEAERATEAIVRLDDALVSLPCVPRLVGADELSALFALRARARLLLDDRRRAFGDALRWAQVGGRGLPEPIFVEAVAYMAEAGSGGISAGIAADELDLLRVDGLEWRLAEHAYRRVAVGVHFVQWRLPDGRVEGLQVIVSRGQDAQLLGFEGRIQALLQAPYLEVDSWIARSLLTDLAQGRPIYLVDLAGRPPTGSAPAYRYTPATGNLEVLPTTTELRRQRRYRRDQLDVFGSGRDRMRLLVGAGWGRLDPHSFLALGLSHSIRLMGPLWMELSVGATYDPDARLLNAAGDRWMPEARVALRMALMRARVQPSVGLAAIVGIDRPAEQVVVVPGAVALLSVDYFASPERGFVLRVEGSTGFERVPWADAGGHFIERRLRLRVGLWLGVGWRF